MGLMLGGVAVDALKLGDVDVDAVYLGDVQVWPSGPPPVTAGSPGAFSIPVPADLAALQALGDLGQTTAWTTGQYVDLADFTVAHWDGSAWASGPAI